MAKKELSRFDSILIDGAAGGKSANELSASVGSTLSPAECLVRVRQILADKDVWTEPERRKLLLHRIYSLTDELTELASNTKDTKDYSALTKALELLRKILSEQGQASEEEIARFVKLQASTMLQFIETAFDYAERQLSERHPDFPVLEVREAFQEGLAVSRNDGTE